MVEKNMKSGRNRYRKLNNNKYIYELNSDSNYIISVSKTNYCVQCGKELDELTNLNRFCDEDCRREYFYQVRRDLNGFAGD